MLPILQLHQVEVLVAVYLYEYDIRYVATKTKLHFEVLVWVKISKLSEVGPIGAPLDSQ